MSMDASKISHIDKRSKKVILSVVRLILGLKDLLDEDLLNSSGNDF